MKQYIIVVGRNTRHQTYDKDFPLVALAQAFKAGWELRAVNPSFVKIPYNPHWRVGETLDQARFLHLEISPGKVAYCDDPDGRKIFIIPAVKGSGASPQEAENILLYEEEPDGALLLDLTVFRYQPPCWFNYHEREQHLLLHLHATLRYLRQLTGAEDHHEENAN